MNDTRLLVPQAGAALATCILYGDAAALEAVLPSMPPYPAVLADAADLLWFVSKAVLSKYLGYLADGGELRAAWQEHRGEIVAGLQVTQGFSDADLDAPLEWCDALMLTSKSEWWLPAHDQAAHLAVISALIAELVGSWSPEEWQDLLLDRETVYDS